MISYELLGTRERFVIHHTDCGMLLFTDDINSSLLASRLVEVPAAAQAGTAK